MYTGVSLYWYTTILFSLCYLHFSIPLFLCLADQSFSFVTVAAFITQKPSSITVEEGQNVSLHCKATGQPKPTVTWRKAFSHVSKERTRVVDGKLTIVKITKADGGAYACSAKNLLGEDSAVALVMVIDSSSLPLPLP